jgi:hypothetical protein
MADDPFAGYKPPSQAQGTDPFAGYSAPASPAAASPAAPSDETWSSYLLRHMAAPGQTLHDFSVGLDTATRAATDWPTYGLADKLVSNLPRPQQPATGNDYSPKGDPQADTAAAHQRLGGWDIPVSLAGSAVSATPELKAASAIGEALPSWLGGGKWLGGVLGSGTVGAGTSALGAYGHEAGWTPDVGDIAKQTAIGTGVGMLSGLPGGVVGRGGTLPPAQTPAALETAMKAEYAPLDAGVFHGPSQVAPALDAVTNTMTGAEKDLAKSTMARVEKLGAQNLVTGSDIQSYQKLFDGLGRTGSDLDRQFAPQFSNALEGVMQNATPYGRNLTPRQGMSLMLPGPLGGTGLAAGDMAAARDAGDQVFGRLQDVDRLQGWQDAAKVAGGPDVGAQARSYLLSDEGQRLAPQGTPRYDAFNTLAGTSAAPSVSGVPSTYDVRHLLRPIAGPLVEGAIVGASGQAAEGHFDPAHFAAEMAIGAGLGYGLHKGTPWAMGKFVQGPAQQRAIDAARVVASTGLPQAPVLPNAPLRNALRSLGFSLGGAGDY